MSGEFPDIREFFGLRKDEIKSEINCVTLGTIQKFYADSQTADISINYKRLIKRDVPEVMDYPMLINCPVVVLNGGGAYVSFPITTGDTCLVLFCDRDIDNWFEDGQASAPNTNRVHDLSDGIAIVGIRSKRNPIANYNMMGPELQAFVSYVKGNLEVSVGATGSFVAKSGETIIVNKGIIISIIP